MSGLRDARLQKALACAPDDSRPCASTRAAILERARLALRREPWWKEIWRSSGERAMPWNAAFATLAIATLVTVLWHAQEVPSPRVDPGSPSPVGSPSGVAADGATSRASPASTPVPQAAQPAPQAPAEAAIPKPAQPADKVIAQSRPTGAAPARVETPATAAASVAPVPRVAPAPPPTAPDAPSAMATAPQLAREAEGVEAMERRRSASAGFAAAESARREAANTQGTPAPPRAALAKTSQDVVAVPVSVIVAGKRHRLPADAPLAVLAERILTLARTDESVDVPVEARIELRRRSGAVDILEVAGFQVRATTVAGSWTVRPDAATLRALRDELAQLR
jgi:hypothetical protein